MVSPEGVVALLVPAGRNPFGDSANAQAAQPFVRAFTNLGGRIPGRPFEEKARAFAVAGVEAYPRQRQGRGAGTSARTKALQEHLEQLACLLRTAGTSRGHGLPIQCVLLQCLAEKLRMALSHSPRRRCDQARSKLCLLIVSETDLALSAAGSAWGDVRWRCHSSPACNRRPMSPTRTSTLPSVTATDHNASP